MKLINDELLAANDIRLHDEVVAVVAWLFGSLRLDVCEEFFQL